MSNWHRHSCFVSGNDETLLIYPLSEGERFDFQSPNFSTSPRPIKFLGIYDSGDAIEVPYDFIMGAEDGSGAFSMPDPRLVMPFRPVSATITMGKKIKSETELLDEMVEFVVDHMKLPEYFKKPNVSRHKRADWHELNRQLRPYYGFYCGIDAEKESVIASDADIYNLKQVFKKFQGPLTGGEIPPCFRDGVRKIIETKTEMDRFLDANI